MNKGILHSVMETVLLLKVAKITRRKSVLNQLHEFKRKLFLREAGGHPFQFSRWSDPITSSRITD